MPARNRDVVEERMRRRRMIAFGVVWACCLWLPVRPGASQEQPAENAPPPAAPSDNPVAPSSDVAAPAPSNETVPPGPPMEPLPPPSEEVMRPTRYGLRLTPGMLKLGTRAWLKEGPFANVGFDERQQADLSQKFSLRVMEAANRYGEQVRYFLETYLEGALTDDDGRNMSADAKQRFGQQGSDLVPAMHDLLKDLAGDARPLLTEKQWEAFKKDLDRELANIDRSEKKFKRWSEGGARENEGLDDRDGGRDKPSGDGNSADANASPRVSGALREARRRAENDMRRMGPVGWREFLMSAKAFFGFDAEQMAKGEQLLAEYSRRLEPIMTPKWRQQVRENRIKNNLRRALNREGMQPWIFHLESESRELMAPLKELENEFCDKVIALARPEQRDAAIGTLRERAAQHGLEFTELDAELLRMLPE